MFLVVLTRNTESIKSIPAIILAQGYVQFSVTWLARQISNERTIINYPLLQFSTNKIFWVQGQKNWSSLIKDASALDYLTSILKLNLHSTFLYTCTVFPSLQISSPLVWNGPLSPRPYQSSKVWYNGPAQH